MNIVLIGYRCTGKTSVGEALARELRRDFADTDRLIEKKVGRSTESFIYEMGWDNFRGIERQMVDEISKKDKMVIATGGGVVMDERNIASLKENGWVVWLKAQEDILRKRMEKDNIGGNKRTPIMGSNSLEEIKKVLELRKPLYSRMGDASIDCGTLTVAETVDLILEQLPEGI
jgi:shikimate kinase